ncbi:MAG: amidase family protein [Chloroflexota bacterium]|nr:amidase family protein [Chloroflexota bacterium]
MTGIDPLQDTIAGVGQLIKGRELSPVELTKACIRQAERVDPALKAFTTLCAEYAMTRARQAEAEIAGGNYRGPLHGVPYTLKDVIATSEVRTTWGNPREIDFKPEKSATVHNLLEEEGASFWAKSTLTSAGERLR